VSVKRSSRGILITLEGPEGSGKTTQLPLLADWLEARGYAVLKTREPGGTSIGESIRNLLHDPAHTEMTSRAEILLYSASRAQLVAEVIQPALQAGKIVLCDRYFDSTFAYQGYGRGLPLEALQEITQFATGGLMPDVTFYLDIEPEEGLRRRADGGEEMNRLDRETLAFHCRVREGYQALIAADPERWVTVDARGTVEAVRVRLQDAFDARFEQAATSSR